MRERPFPDLSKKTGWLKNRLFVFFSVAPIDKYADLTDA
jgi:hypothetical protein